MPVRKVRLKDGSVGYQWGTTGKVYKRREDAEAQGRAIKASQRKRKMKISKQQYNQLREKVGELEKLINGGKGSGNFGHAGRPGEIGGSAPAGGGSAKISLGEEHDEYDFDAKGYLSSTGALEGFFPETSEYYADGEHFTVHDGEGVSDDGKRVVTLPGETLFQTSDYMGKGVNPTKRLSAFQEITHKMREHGFSTEICDKVGSYAMAEHELFATEGDKTAGLKNVDSAARDARKAIKDHIVSLDEKGTGTDFDRRILKAVSEEIYRGQRGSHEALENKDENSFGRKTLNGGKGSGNFGHSGRPGEIGGSAPSGASSGLEGFSDEEKIKYYKARLADEEKARAKAIERGVSEEKASKLFDKTIDSLKEDIAKAEGANKPKEIKGGTKAEKEAIKSLIGAYDEDRGFAGVLEDAKAAGLPGDSNYQKAVRWVEGGGAAVYYDDVYEDLKSIYGEKFKESTYKTKSGDWKYKDGEPYVWTIYKAKLAKAIADELDKEGNSMSLYESLSMKLNELEKALNGGKGSGNFGHAGRPGEVGGSAPEGAHGAKLYKKIADENLKTEVQDVADYVGDATESNEDYKDAHKKFQKETDAHPNMTKEAKALDKKLDRLNHEIEVASEKALKKATALTEKLEKAKDSKTASKVAKEMEKLYKVNPSYETKQLVERLKKIR